MIATDALRHQPLVLDGERVGDLVSLGLRVVFYTTDKRLADLDGRHFTCFESAAAAVRESLAAERARTGRHQRSWRTGARAAATRARVGLKPKQPVLAFPSADAGPLDPADRRSGH